MRINMKISRLLLCMYTLTLICLLACQNKSTVAVNSVANMEGEVVEEVMEEAAPAPKPNETHMAVDLGLPSGIKWATTNLGASSFSEFGEYYALGDIYPKEEGRDYQGAFGWLNGPLVSRSNPRYRETEKLSLLGNPKYDAATANWGDAWRMPTDHETYELQTECAWIWTTENGNSGQRIIGPNGNSIFLPAAGYFKYERVIAENEDGYYWKARDIEYRNTDTDSFSCMYFTNRIKSSGDENYQTGLSVRPVTCNSDDRPDGDLVDTKGREYTIAKSGEIAGHRYVDLGLPSGTKWATMNIDAKNYFDYGSCFEWGANSPDVSFEGHDSKTLGNEDDVKIISGNPKYDAAAAMWGETWRLPTNEEIQELVEFCQWTVFWKGEDRVYVGMGPNKNLIIFPIYQGNRGRRLSSIWGGEPDDYNTAHYMDLTDVTQYNGTQRPILTTGKQTGQLRIRPVSK